MITDFMDRDLEMWLYIETNQVKGKKCEILIRVQCKLKQHELKNYYILLKLSCIEKGLVAVKILDLTFL